MVINSRRPSGLTQAVKPVAKKEEKKVERKVREKKVVKKEEPILPLVEEALASIEE